MKRKAEDSSETTNKPKTKFQKIVPSTNGIKVFADPSPQKKTNTEDDVAMNNGTCGCTCHQEAAPSDQDSADVKENISNKQRTEESTDKDSHKSRTKDSGDQKQLTAEEEEAYDLMVNGKYSNGPGIQGQPRFYLILFHSV